MPIDLSPIYSQGDILTAHYGSPVISRGNTIFVPVKVGAYDGFRVEARNGATGALIYTLDTDYSIATGSSWMPSFGPALGRDKLYVPAAGGTILARKNPDATGIGPVKYSFVGPDAYNSAHQLYDETVKICTPLTVDGKDNVWFGYRTYGDAADETPIGKAAILSGIARIDAQGNGAWRSAKAIAKDADAVRIQFQCAPAVSDNDSIVYFSVQLRVGGGYLVGLDTKTLETKYRARLLDPVTGNDAIISSQSSASPMIAPDGDVYFGILSNPQAEHNHRGYLLHFDKTLSTQKLIGGFGWDNTPSLVPAAAIPGFKGSPYLILSKYNNYAGFGDGINRVALLDPLNSTTDPISSATVMNELATVAGPMEDPAWASPDYPSATYEWCINAAAVDPYTHCAMVNSEDGRLYRWDFTRNALTQGILLEGPRGQAYTPTIIGPTGITYAINNAKLFAVGQ